MFKFILLAFFTAGTVIAAVTAQTYDETADIVEMAFETADASDNTDNIDNALADDTADDGTGYVYSDGALEDNINVAVNAAILDKYGQAVTSERAEARGESLDQVADKSDNVQNVEKVQQKIKTSTKSAAFRSKQLDDDGDARVSGDNNVRVNADKTVKAPKTVKTPQNENTDTIVRYASQVNTDGTYGFDFAQSSGLEFKEVGHGGHFAEGSYQYISPEGELISVTYRADETGFHPESDSLPTPPPIPSYILKALEYIKEHPTAEELADREVRAQQI